jgi:hypothetical protein
MVATENAKVRTSMWCEAVVELLVGHPRKLVRLRKVIVEAAQSLGLNDTAGLVSIRWSLSYLSDARGCCINQRLFHRLGKKRGAYIEQCRM